VRTEERITFRDRDGDWKVMLTAHGLLALAAQTEDPVRAQRLRVLAALRKVAAIRRLTARGFTVKRS
jgi:type VI protein secretion system component VasA